jgi:uncharacterized protein (DUF1499 family)
MIIDFKTLELGDAPNQTLVLPDGFNSISKPHLLSPIFPIPIDSLYHCWLHMVNKQPRVKLIAQATNKNQYEFLQRSAVFHFPDIITVQFLSLPDNHSSLAAYSRSKYGYYDFGVNRRRMVCWLDLLKQEVERMSSQSVR